MRRNLPNAITLSRLLLVPPIVLGILGEASLAVAMLLLAAALDVLDGVLARRLGEVTPFGQTVDPLVDKVVIASALLALVAEGRVPLWVLLAVLARDVAVTCLRFVAAKRDVVIPASRLGKRKMDLQLLAVLAAIVASDPGAWWVETLLVLAVGLTIVSGVGYFASLIRGSRRKAVQVAVGQRLPGRA